MTPEDEVWGMVVDLYAAYLAGDRSRLEAHIARGCTMWDSTRPGLARFGSPALEPASAGVPWPEPVDLVATPLRVQVWGDVALEVHDLQARFADPALEECLRCTSVLERRFGRWVFVHHHEEMLTGPGREIPARGRRT